MKVTEFLDRAKEPLISYEIIPPQRGHSVQLVFDIVEALMRFEPPFIDVTSHSAEVYYEDLPDGTLRRHVKRKRPGTIGLCAAIKGRFGIETVPHILCNGFTREETEDALIELHYLGLENVMALRGDECEVKKPARPDRTINTYALELVQQIHRMNEGLYLDDSMETMERTDFCVGVAGYPEKHFEAPNRAWDIQNLKKKVDAGADYVVTQMFFDNAHFFDYVEQCRAAGITVPIIPGLKVLTSRRQLQLMPRHFYVDIPEDLAGEVAAAAPEHVTQVGIDWAIRQSEELLSAGVPCVHFYIMQSASVITRVVEPLRRMA